MKKIVVTGIILVLVMFAVTCEAGFPKEEDDYTDVVYSEDGSRITVYLDGVGVPVTPTQRAMTRNLAMMAYDYLEVIFTDGTTNARSSWELGQAAGISGVKRDFDYASADNACIFVGVKGDKTLLGVGKIIEVDNAPVTGTAMIESDTKSVTFGVSAILTGLCVWDKSAVDEDDDPAPAREKVPEVISGNDTLTATQIAEAVALFDSFDWIATGGTATPYPDEKSSSRFAMDNGQLYPMYTLPGGNGGTVTAKYEFSTVGEAITAYGNAIKNWGGTRGNAMPLAQMRVPRYMDKGRYLQPKANVNTDTLTEIDTTYLTAAQAVTTGTPPNTTTTYTNFNPIVPLQFTIYGTGIFSFYLQMPVFMVNNEVATNGGPDAERWYIRTGLGSELYSIDNGKGSGGCVLMGIDITDLDWLNIFWDFLEYK